MLKQSKRVPAAPPAADHAAGTPTTVRPPAPAVLDFADIKAQESAKRAITIALAGSHSIVLIGPSGHGKTMLIAAARGLDPTFPDRAREITLWRRSEDPQKRSKAMEALMRLNHELQVEVPLVPFRELSSRRPGTDSSIIARQMARARQYAASHTDLTLGDACLLLMKQAYDELGLSPRSYQIIIRVARTIASMEQADPIQEQHIAEAVQYRLLDRRF